MLEAIDTLDHIFFIQKLNHYCPEDLSLALLHNYLTNRKQYQYRVFDWAVLVQYP